MLFGQLPSDPDRARLDVDIGAAQGSQLAPSQTAENGEQHQGAVPPVDGISHGVDLGDRQDRPLRGDFLPSTFDPARVTPYQPVIQRQCWAPP